MLEINVEPNVRLPNPLIVAELLCAFIIPQGQTLAGLREVRFILQPRLHSDQPLAKQHFLYLVTRLPRHRPNINAPAEMRGHNWSPVMHFEHGIWLDSSLPAAQRLEEAKPDP